MQSDLFQSAAERAARKCGWTKHGSRRFERFDDGRPVPANELVPFYFYHRESDGLDCDSKSWEELAARQPRISALVQQEQRAARANARRKSTR